MTKQFTDILDEALEAVKTEPVTAVLERYPDQAQTLAPLLTAAEKLGEWQTAVPPTPNPDWQTPDRASFLDQIEQLLPAPVSPSPLMRLKGWLLQKRTALLNRNTQKEHKPMNAIFARAIATSLVLFGLAGGVSKAMVTTAGGLVVAIPVMLFYTYFRGKVQGIAHEIETYGTDIIKIFEEMGA